MTYLDTIKSRCCWYAIGSEISVSGCKINYIHGYLGVGSPHGPLVLFNNQIEYNRPVGNLQANISVMKYNFYK